ncbi:MAG: hypothetical protein GY795_10050 [Desulfobacterales bacterium]|nr:hypothetical protein [Desulfobacterales bacterium]
MEFFKKIKDKVSTAKNIEEVAIEFVDELCRNNEDYILARMFIILPFSMLPLNYQVVANHKVQSYDTTAQLNKQTSVLSLLATRGENQ